MAPKVTQKSSANVEEFNRFLNNNAEFLAAKYSQYFQSQKIYLSQLNKQKAIGYINDVFGFAKYENDTKMNKMLKDSLTDNIKNFTIEKDGKNSKKANKGSIQFDNSIAVELLRYCIQNNQMFAVHYDRKQLQQQVTEIAKQVTQKDKQVQQITPQTNQFQNKEEKQQDNLQTEGKREHQQFQSKDQTEGHQQKDQTEGHQQKDQNEQIIKNSSKVSFRQEYNKSQVQPDIIENQFNKNLLERQTQQEVRKKMKILFNFYCRQLHSLGGHTTFQRINHQCQALGLGKFMVFCHATEVFEKYTQLNKKGVINTFMKVSHGSKEIGFDQFCLLIEKLSLEDPALMDRLGMNDPKVFREKRKHLTKPFNTKDNSIREVKMYNRIKIASRQNIATSNRVKESVRKSISRSRSKGGIISPVSTSRLQNDVQGTNQSTRYLKQDQNGSAIINPNNVSKLSSAHLQEEVDLSFLNKLIKAEDEDDQWLTEYKIPLKKSKVTIPKNIVPSSIRTQRSRNQHQHMSHLSMDHGLSLNSEIKGVSAQRQDSLLKNMKNRIKQIQSSQKKRDYFQNRKAAKSLHSRQ